jgi:hypothetical protein
MAIARGIKDAVWRGGALMGRIVRFRAQLVKFTIVLTAVLVSLLAVTLASPVAGAATASPSQASSYQFSVEPLAAPGSQQRSHFAYELQPGHSVLDQVVILNNSSNPESFIVYPEDAVSVSGSGGIGFQQQGEIHNTTVGKWLRIGQTQFSIPSGKEAVDTFQVAIPVNAQPGDHVGGVIVQQVNQTTQPKSKEGVNLLLRIAVPVYVRVVGPVHPGMTVQSLTVFHDSPLFPYVSGAARVAVRFTLVNTGNVIITPETATVSIKALIGGTLHSYTVHNGTGGQTRSNPLPAQLLPGGKMTVTELWSGIPPFDPMTANVSATANYPGGRVPVVAASSSTFWYFPWLLVLIVVALIVGYIIWRRRRRQNGLDSPSRASDDNVANSDPAESVTEPMEDVGV